MIAYAQQKIEETRISPHVQREVISVLQTMFTKSMTAEKSQIFDEVLKFYKAAVLFDAMRDFKTTWDKGYLPPPAYIKMLCDSVISRKKAAELRLNTQKKWISLAEAEQQALNSKYAKRAFKKNWLNDLVVHFERGKNEFSDLEMDEIEATTKKSMRLASTLSASQFDKHLLSLWHNILARKSELEKKYKEINKIS